MDSEKMIKQVQGVNVRSVIGAVFMASLAACSTTDPRREGVLETFTPEQIFETAEAEVQRGQHDDAAFFFGEIERLHPYSALAQPAAVRQILAYYQDGDYENVRLAARRYLEFYPATEDAAYAQYLLALSYYDQIDEIGRDQALARQALDALGAVIERYPESEYARSAVSRYNLAFDHLAGKEMEVGRYYLKRGHYSSAINRFRAVVESYETTSHTPEALHRLVESYLSLGLKDEAQTAGAILGYNYRGSEWYQDSYALLTGEGLRPEASGDNWLASIYRRVVRGEWL